MQKMPGAGKKKRSAWEAGSRFAKAPIRKPSHAARKAADKIASILEEHLNTLPAAERAAKLKAFHGSVNASFAAPATSVSRSNPLV